MCLLKRNQDQKEWRLDLSKLRYQESVGVNPKKQQQQQESKKSV